MLALLHIQNEDKLVLYSTSDLRYLCAEQVIDGLDRAVKTMKKGEIALVTSHPDYAFGSSDSQQELAIVPAISTLLYEVEMISFVKVSVGYIPFTLSIFFFT